MIAAILNGCIGLALGLAVGKGLLGFTTLDTLGCLFVSNVAALISLVVTLQVELMDQKRKIWFTRSSKTWAFLCLIYFGIVLLLCPLLRDGRNLLILFVPMLLSTGFCILIFGPIQDQLVRRRQRK